MGQLRQKYLGAYIPIRPEYYKSARIRKERRVTLNESCKINYSRVTAIIWLICIFKSWNKNVGQLSWTSNSGITADDDDNNMSAFM